MNCKFGVCLYCGRNYIIRFLIRSIMVLEIVKKYEWKKIFLYGV